MYNLVEDAKNLAEQAHRGQVRTHILFILLESFEVGKILIDEKMEEEVIASGYKIYLITLILK